MNRQHYTIKARRTSTRRSFMKTSAGLHLILTAFIQIVDIGLICAKPVRCSITLAGGDGIRLRRFVAEYLGVNLPKQYVRFTRARSMLEETWQRAEILVPRERIFTIVGKSHWEYPEARRQLSSRPEGTVIVQPRNRETGPGLLLALTYLHGRYPQSTVAVFPSDHFILKEDVFMAHVDRAFRLVESDPAKIVLIGVEPTRVEPEYGYILPGSPLSTSVPSFHRVKAFVEKPALESAAELLSAGALWNTMVMVFGSETLLELTPLTAPSLPDELFHELRGHLTVIVMCCGTLRQALERVVSEDQIHDLYTIEANATKVCDLAKQFYSLAEISERNKVAAWTDRALKLPALIIEDNKKLSAIFNSLNEGKVSKTGDESSDFHPPATRSS